MASLAWPEASQANADTWVVSLLHCSVSAGEEKEAGSSAIRAKIHLKSAWVVMVELHCTQGPSQTQLPSITYFQVVIRVRVSSP